MILRLPWDKTLVMGKVVRSVQTPHALSQDERDVIADNYMHCSVKWNAIVVNTGAEFSLAALKRSYNSRREGAKGVL